MFVWIFSLLLFSKHQFMGLLLHVVLNVVVWCGVCNYKWVWIILQSFICDILVCWEVCKFIIIDIRWNCLNCWRLFHFSLMVRSWDRRDLHQGNLLKKICTYICLVVYWNIKNFKAVALIVLPIYSVSAYPICSWLNHFFFGFVPVLPLLYVWCSNFILSYLWSLLLLNVIVILSMRFVCTWCMTDFG